MGSGGESISIPPHLAQLPIDKVTTYYLFPRRFQPTVGNGYKYPTLQICPSDGKVMGSSSPSMQGLLGETGRW